MKVLIDGKETSAEESVTVIVEIPRMATRRRDLKAPQVHVTFENQCVDYDLVDRGVRIKSVWEPQEDLLDRFGGVA